MPTVTVLAWCLIASTGRVSSSIALVSAAMRSCDDRARGADLAVLELVESSDTAPVAYRNSDASRTAVLASSVPS